MSTPEQRPLPAWEPLTPQGVAAFARASTGRLLLVQLVVAALAAGCVVWVLYSAWFPVVRSAIHQLPATGDISGQQLHWSGTTSVQLAGNRFLGIAVDLNHSGQLARDAHLQLEFGREDLRVYSLLGYHVYEYPAGWRVGFNRTQLDPWWGAWEPGFLVGAALGTIVGLLVTWTVLATVYCLPVRLITFYQNRDLTLVQSWRFAGAAVMPGALFMTFGIFAYGLNLVDLLQFGCVVVLHFLIGLIYLFISPLFLPRSPAASGSARGNPFAKSPATKKSPL